MKRRGFLRLLGAAATAPLMPALPTVAAPAAATVTPAALHASILHAQSQISISRWGLMTKLGVTKTEADALMVELSNRGVIGPLSGMKGGSPWARSRIAQPAFRKSAQQSASNQATKDATPAADRPSWSVRYNGLWEHVALVAVRHGIA